MFYLLKYPRLPLIFSSQPYESLGSFFIRDVLSTKSAVFFYVWFVFVLMGPRMAPVAGWERAVSMEPASATAGGGG